MTVALCTVSSDDDDSWTSSPMPLTTEERTWFRDAIESLDAGKALVTLAHDGQSVRYADVIRSSESRVRAADPEELTRAVVVLLLCSDEYGYKPESLHLERSFTIGRGVTSGAQVDIIVYNEDGGVHETAFAMVELKAPSEYKPNTDSAIRKQLFDTAKQVNPTLLTYGTVRPTGVPKFECITIDYTMYKDYEKWDEEGRPAT